MRFSLPSIKCSAPPAAPPSFQLLPSTVLSELYAQRFDYRIRFRMLLKGTVSENSKSSSWQISKLDKLQYIKMS